MRVLLRICAPRRTLPGRCPGVNSQKSVLERIYNTNAPWREHFPEIFLEEEAHVAHHRGIGLLHRTAAALLQETYYDLEEEAHVSHQRVVASHCCSATEAPSTPLMQQKSLAVVNSSCKCPTASRKPHVPPCTTATPTQPRRRRSKP